MAKRLLIVSCLFASCGCSSMGLSLWPSQFPLLTKTKRFAAANSGYHRISTELDKAPLVDYYVEPGDRILIEPIELDPDLRITGDQQIQIDGSIDLGKYGRLRVAGQSVEAIEQTIANRIAEVDGEPEAVNVQLAETNAAKVYVLGAVGSPGSYPLQGNELVLDAILMAGGLISTASPCDIILVRPTPACDCRVVLPVCYRQITQLGDAGTNYQLQPGDRIVVGSRTLFEELAVWRQSRGCPHCCESRCVEKHPAKVGYLSRFQRLFPPFALPESSTEEVDELQTPAPETDQTPIEDPDADLFLQPLGEDADQQSSRRRPQSEEVTPASMSLQR